MSAFNSEWWSLQFSDDWSAEQDETCTSMFSKSGVGALQSSAALPALYSISNVNLQIIDKAHLHSL